MNRLLGWLLAALLLLGVGAWGILVWGPQTSEIWCDGAYPVWMLEAQDYGGGGCVEVWPSDAAPPNADWRAYCVGMCNPADFPANQEYRFGP